MKFRLLERFRGSDRSVFVTRVRVSPQTRWGQIYLHIFHRGDADPDPHDHPSPFWTFPFRSYVELVMLPNGQLAENIVRAWRWHKREATYVHLIKRPLKGSFPLFTLIWRQRSDRAWGFWVPSPEPPTRWWMPSQAYFDGVRYRPTGSHTLARIEGHNSAREIGTHRTNA